MLISLISAKGSPGVTTSALALASRWPRHVLVADLDPLCGDVLAGLGQGRIPAERNVVELMVAARTMGVAAALPQQLIKPQWPTGCPTILPGLGGPGHARGLPWDALAAGLASLPWAADVVADCGRWGISTSTPVLRVSALVVLVLRSTLRSVHAAARTAPVLKESLDRHAQGSGNLVAMVVGSREPYTDREIRAALGIPLIGGLPWDPKAARVWSDGAPEPRGFAASLLQRAAGATARDVFGLAERRQAELHAHTTARTPLAPPHSAPSANGARPRLDDTASRRLPGTAAGPSPELAPATGEHITLRPLPSRGRGEGPDGREHAGRPPAAAGEGSEQ